MKRTIIFVAAVCLCYGSLHNANPQPHKRQPRPQQKTSQPQKPEQVTKPPNTQTLNDQLVAAVKCGNTARVKTLLASGADPNVRSGLSGDTPLLIASWRGDKTIIQALLEKGADVNVTDQTEWHLAPLLVASACGWVPVVELLLGIKGIDVKVADKAGATAWTQAAMAEDEALTQKVRELLVAKGTPQVGSGQVFQWVLQTPTYACRRNSGLTERFKGNNCGSRSSSQGR